MLIVEYLWNLRLIVKYLWNLMLIVKYLWNLMLILKNLWNLMLVFVSEGATKQHHQPLWTWKPAWTIQTGNRINKTKKMKFHFNISWERNCPNVSYLWILSHVCPGPRPNRGPNLDHNAPAPWRARQRDRAGAHRQQHRTGGWQPCQDRHDQHLFFSAWAGQDWWGEIKEWD